MISTLGVEGMLRDKAGRRPLPSTFKVRSQQDENCL